MDWRNDRRAAEAQRPVTHLGVGAPAGLAGATAPPDQGLRTVTLVEVFTGCWKTQPPFVNPVTE